MRLEHLLSGACVVLRDPARGQRGTVYARCDLEPEKEAIGIAFLRAACLVGDRISGKGDADGTSWEVSFGRPATRTVL